MGGKLKTGANRSCIVCGSVQYIPKYRLDSFKYCSRSCLAIGSRIEHESNCHVCGILFKHISSRANKAKYCSRACYYKSLKGKGSVEHECAYCHKKFMDSPSKNRKYCSRACINKSSKDNWVSSISSIRKYMLARDMVNKCNRCGYDTNPNILGIHHKDRNRANNNINNLEVLCPNCHSLEHMKHIPHGFKE